MLRGSSKDICTDDRWPRGADVRKAASTISRSGTTRVSARPPLRTSTVIAPSASFDLTAFADHAEVAWRLGTYRADAAKFQGQNDFDYAAYFTGNLTGCQFSQGTCAWDPAKRCLTLKCARTHIDCPPADLPRCPGWTYDECTHKYVCEHECATKSPTGCCQAAAGTDDDVMHGKRYHVENPLCCPYDTPRTTTTAPLRTRVPARASRRRPSGTCLLYTSPRPRDRTSARMPSSA